MNLVLVLLALLNPLVFAEIEEKTFDGSNLNELVLKNSVGDVRISASKDGKAYVKANKIKWGKGCSLTMEKKDKQLVATLDQSIRYFSKDCKIEFDIQVPRNIDLTVRLASGDCSISGIKGKVDLTVGSGNLTSDGEIHSFKAKAGSGTIQTSGLTGDADIETGSGNVSLTYTTAPQKGSIDVISGSGNIAMAFPEGLNAKVKFVSGSGQLKNEFSSVDDAPFKITARTGSGDLTIAKSKPNE